MLLGGRCCGSALTRRCQLAVCVVGRFPTLAVGKPLLGGEVAAGFSRGPRGMARGTVPPAALAGGCGVVCGCGCLGRNRLPVWCPVLPPVSSRAVARCLLPSGWWSVAAALGLCCCLALLGSRCLPVVAGLCGLRLLWGVPVRVVGLCLSGLWRVSACGSGLGGLRGRVGPPG